MMRRRLKLAARISQEQPYCTDAMCWMLPTCEILIRVGISRNDKEAFFVVVVYSPALDPRRLFFLFFCNSFEGQHLLSPPSRTTSLGSLVVAGRLAISPAIHRFGAKLLRTCATEERIS